MRQEDDLRYSRLSDILQIVIKMQGTSKGLSLDEIAEEIGVKRRTAERIKNAILRNFSQIKHLPSDGKQKRWGFVNSTAQREFASSLISFSDDEILELEKLKVQFKDNQKLYKNLKSVVDKIKALMRDSKNSLQQEKIMSLLELEGYAINQFSNNIIAETVIKMIRQALVEKHYLTFVYKKRNGTKSKRTVAPYGILYGSKNYLVANDKKIKLFDLDCISNIDITNETFIVDEKFNLKDYASKSFGIYQETPLKVKLLFDEKTAEDVEKYHFHPTQKITKLNNGKIEVWFEAGGTKSICWELFKWGEHVQIIEPYELKDLYKKELSKILSAQDVK